MTFFVLFVLFVGILASSVFTNKKTPYRYSFVFLLIALAFLGVSFCCCMIYLIKDNFYSSIIRQYFLLPQNMINQIAFLSIDGSLLINLLNLSSLCFVLFCWIFSVYYAKIHIRICRPFFLIFPPCLFVGAEFFLFSPEFYRMVYAAWYNHPQFGALWLQRAWNTLHLISNWLNALFLLAAAGLVLFSSTKIPKFKELKYNGYLLCLTLVLTESIYLFLCHWVPMNLVKVSMVADGMQTFLSLPLGNHPILYRGISWVYLLSLLLLFVSITRQLRLQRNVNKERFLILKDIDAVSFAARVFCHYLKNEVLSIRAEIGFAQAAPTQDGLLECVGRIDRRCEEICSHLNTIYDISKQQQIKLKKDNIIALLKGVLEDETPFPNGVQVTARYPGPELWCLLDASYFAQAVESILRNSVEAVQALEQDRRRIEIRVWDQPPWVKLEFSDRGPGISAERLDRIFNPFYSTKDSSTNWGMGLSFVQKIIAAHEGKIQIDSREGAYTKVVILLPQYNTDAWDI